MSWLGGSFSSITGQLSNLTKDILTEGTEEISDPSTELRLAKEKVQQLDSIVTSQRHENERLKRINKELEEKAESAELQINSISSQYRAVLEEKEREVNTLKQQHQELLEEHARSAALTPSNTPSDRSASPHADWNTGLSWSTSAGGGEDFASINYDGDQGDWDFEDNIRLQRDNNKLRSEVKRLQSQVKHWTSVAGQLGQNGGHDSTRLTASTDVLDLKQKVTELETELSKTREDLQHQAASLHDHHQEKVARLKSKHKTELDGLTSQISGLEQQLADTRDGSVSSLYSSSGNLPESDWREAGDVAAVQAKLTQAILDKEKAQNARHHLEGMLEELQQEVERLQQQQDNGRSSGVAAKTELDLQTKVDDLSRKLEESEAERLSLCERLDEKSELQQSLQSVKTEQEEVRGSTDVLLEQIGDSDKQRQTTELFECLEKENLILKEEKLKLEEQVTLLEKCAVTNAEDRQRLQAMVSSLKVKLHNVTGEEWSVSEDTCDTDMSSVSSEQGETTPSALHIGQEEIDRELSLLRSQLEKQENELSGIEMERADWHMEREALEDVVTDLRHKTQDQEHELQSLKTEKSSGADNSSQVSAESSQQIKTLEAEITSLKSGKEELESALEELDSQHDQALNQLIAQRDQLASQLAECTSELEQQKDVILSLNQTVEGLKSELAAKTDSMEELEKEKGAISELNQTVERLKAELAAKGDLEEELSSSKKSASECTHLESEIQDLKDKLHKGGLVLNDLHMDKQELAEQLRKAKEEITVKVSKMKELREENVKLGNEKQTVEKRLAESEERLGEMEEEVERWQQLNEDAQVRQLEAGRKLEENKVLSQIEKLEQENSAFTSGLQHLIKDNSTKMSENSSVEDGALSSILAEEAKVRMQMESDGVLINDLREEIKKLYEDKKKLKKDLKKEKIERENFVMQSEKLENDIVSYQTEIENTKKEMSELEKNCQSEIVKNQELHSKLSVVEQKLEEAGKQHEELVLECEHLQKTNTSLEDSVQSQQQYIDNSMKDFNHSKESSLQEHDRLLDLQNNKQLEVDALRARLQDQEKLVTELREKTSTVDNLMQTIATFTEEVASVKEEITRLENACEEKDERIEHLKSQVIQFGTDLDEIESSVSVAEDKHILEISGKEGELKQLHERNIGLERSLSQTQEELQVVRRFSNAGTRSESQPEVEGVPLGQLNEETELLEEKISQLNIEICLKDETITNLRQDFASAKSTIECHEAGIADLNEKAENHRKELEKAESDATMQKSHLAVLRQTSVDKDSLMKEYREKMSFLMTILTSEQLQKVQHFSDNSSNNIPALEYKDVKAIGYHDVENPMTMSSNQQTCHSVNETNFNGCLIDEVGDEDEVDNTLLDQKRYEVVEKELEELRGRLQEKDIIVSELQKSNSSLLGLLEGKGDRSITTQVAAHKIDAELRSLRAEREQMVAVVSEKSRENSNLKGEVHRLMEVATANQVALDKLQTDNRALEHWQRSPPRGNEAEEDEMRREALANMARLVRDRETEIEALQLKNTTLLAVLQESSSESQAAAHLGPLLKEKENLTEQVTAMTTEREQLIACLTQKHSESVAYHGEMQRLAGLVASVQDEAEKAKNDYNSLIPSFEDKSRALVSAHAEVVEMKQKLKDLEVRHGELIQFSSNQKSRVNPDLSAAEANLERQKLVESDLRSSLAQRDEKLHNLSHKVAGLEESVASKDAECALLKKQTDSSKFQLTSLNAELSDLKTEREKMLHKSGVQDSECTSLRNSVNKLNLTLREKDGEVSSLREQVSTLSSLLQEQQGESSQVTQLMKENENAVESARHLLQERDQQALLAEQRLQECHSLRAEVQQCKDKEFKLTRELDRLRGHLIQIEEGYTKEALDSEEREKDLRNRLAVAEERLTSSSSQVEMASQESSRHIQSLEQQLHTVASQRDSAYMQVATIQDQCQQYASSLGNLQLVLEHFQKEKDSAIAAETQRYEDEIKKLKVKMTAMQNELEATRGDLAEALDGLEAANRLSEQLDRKEDVVQALKEEVHLRENALAGAEEQIHKLTSSKEAKVDKVLMHNMMMTWLTSPESKRAEIVQLIGNILSFSPEDFEKIDSAHGKVGLLSSIFRRHPEHTPAKQNLNQSFSQLFVKFLERESSPPPSPVRLPAEAMAAETQHRHKPPAFNPFMAPRHVSHEGARSSWSDPSSASHLLSHDSPMTTPLFAPLTSTPSSTESAILKDVLGKR